VAWRPSWILATNTVLHRLFLYAWQVSVSQYVSHFLCTDFFREQEVFHDIPQALKVSPDITQVCS
jgi:hypothetical protein